MINLIDRVERIKAAREEAALEVAKLKQAKQADYLMHEKSILADLNTMVEDCNQQTKLELEKMQSEAVDRIPSAAELLLNRVLSVSSPTSSETQ